MSGPTIFIELSDLWIPDYSCHIRQIPSFECANLYLHFKMSKNRCQLALSLLARSPNRAGERKCEVGIG